MSYFDKFPATYFRVGDYTYLVPDITRRIAMRQRYKDVADLYSTYTVQDGDKPEMVAYRMYGNASLHWIILLFNDIINPYYDWPMSQQELLEYCKDKYGVPGLYQTAYWVKDGLVVDSGTPLASAVSNIEHEERLNDEKREIRILLPALVQQFVTEFEEMVNG